jgi:hypothetical protein
MSLRPLKAVAKGKKKKTLKPLNAEALRRRENAEEKQIVFGFFAFLCASQRLCASALRGLDFDFHVFDVSRQLLKKGLGGICP